MTAHLFGDDPDVRKNDMPDARLRPCNRSTIVGPCGIMARVYCVNCGCDGGLVTDEWAEQIMYLCDRCAEVHGKLPVALQVPDSEVRGTSDPMVNLLAQP